MRGPNKKLTPFGKLVVKALADQDMTKAELAAEVGVAPPSKFFCLEKTGSYYKKAVFRSVAPHIHADQPMCHAL